MAAVARERHSGHTLVLHLGWGACCQAERLVRSPGGVTNRSSGHSFVCAQSDTAFASPYYTGNRSSMADRTRRHHVTCRKTYHRLWAPVPRVPTVTTGNHTPCDRSFGMPECMSQCPKCDNCPNHSFMFHLCSPKNSLESCKVSASYRPCISASP